MTTDEIKALIVQRANACNIPANIALVQLARESANFNQTVIFGRYVGGSGERGIAQFTSGTWARFGSGPHDPNAYDINLSLDAWCAYMTYLLGLFGGDMTKALQGYNGGEGNVIRGTVSSAARNYAAQILAGAGFQAGSSGGGDGGPIVVEPTNGNGEPEPTSAFPLLLLLGAGALLLIVFTRE